MIEKPTRLTSRSTDLRRDLEAFSACLLSGSNSPGSPRWPEERTQLNYTGASGPELMRRTVDFVEFLAQEVPILLTNSWRGLDYGAGWGRIASLMGFFGPAANLDCGDAWQKSIDLAKGCDLNNRFVLLPARLSEGELPVKEYDLIYSYSIFTHLPRTHIVNNLANLMASLKPGGKLVFTLRQEKFIDYLKRSNKFAPETDELDTHGYWFGNAQSADYGDTVVTSDWVERNLGGLGQIRTIGPLATEPFQSVTILTKA